VPDNGFPQATKEEKGARLAGGVWLSVFGSGREKEGGIRKLESKLWGKRMLVPQKTGGVLWKVISQDHWTGMDPDEGGEKLSVERSSSQGRLKKIS